MWKVHIRLPVEVPSRTGSSPSAGCGDLKAFIQIAGQQRPLLAGLPRSTVMAGGHVVIYCVSFCWDDEEAAGSHVIRKCLWKTKLLVPVH